MKQATFLVEIVVDKTSPTIIIRDAQRGQIVKVTTSPDGASSFLKEVIESYSKES